MLDQNTILNQLNPEQQEVAKTTQGPVLVLAGAGSGKTRCIIHRVAWLITQEKVNPWQILVVTFTNKAATELKIRLENILHQGIKMPWVGTFHSICLKILRYELINFTTQSLEAPDSEQNLFANYTANFTIYDRDDQSSLLKRIYNRLNIDKKTISIDRVLSIISKQKSNVILPKDFFLYQERNQYTELFHQLYVQYDQSLKKENAMDFDDILLNTVLLLKNRVELKHKYQNYFQYLMVDEYQDTNYVQFQFVKLLAETHQNICVVGDDDQAIYGWRGANIANILNFQNDYQKVKIVKLERNYRSSQNILDIANQLIAKNQNRHLKELWSKIDDAFIPQLIAHNDEYEETRFILDFIAEKQKAGENLSEIVVLYRTNFQSRILESMFASKHIPFQVIGSFRFFKRAEIKDLIAWLRFLINPDDLESCMRIINTPPRGIGKSSIDALILHSFQNDLSIMQALEQVEAIKDIKPASKRALTNFFQLISYLHENTKDRTISEIIKLIIKEFDLYEYYQLLDTKEMTDKVENINEFISAAVEFEKSFTLENERQPDLSDFINNLSLQSDVDEYDSKKETVKLMTMHCVKGLEFKYVFIVGLEEGLIPHILCSTEKNEIEEERRLLYVAITRAQKELYLNYAHCRRIAGKTNYQNKSRFLKDLEGTNLDSPQGSLGFSSLKSLKKLNLVPIHLNKTKQKQLDCVLENEKYYKIGMQIRHAEYGKGLVLSVDGAGDDAKLTVSFDHGGLKKILGKWVDIV